jgi:hypothetical protein
MDGTEGVFLALMCTSRHSSPQRPEICGLDLVSFCINPLAS